MFLKSEKEIGKFIFSEMLSLIQHVPDTLIVTYNQHVKKKKNRPEAVLPDSSHLLWVTKPLTEFPPYTTEIYTQCFFPDPHLAPAAVPAWKRPRDDLLP